METYDILSIGRSSLDLYANDIGAAFPDIKSFGAFVGGCPTNISVGVQRLGLQAALLTAVGEDPVGEFLLKFLENEGVETQFIPHKSGYRTSAVVLGIEPPLLSGQRKRSRQQRLQAFHNSQLNTLKSQILQLKGISHLPLRRF